MRIEKHDPGIYCYLTRIVVLGPMVMEPGYYQQKINAIGPDGAGIDISAGSPYLKPGTLVVKVRTTWHDKGIADASCDMGENFGFVCDLAATAPLSPEAVEELRANGILREINLSHQPYLGKRAFKPGPKPKEWPKPRVGSIFNACYKADRSGEAKFWVYTAGWWTEAKTQDGAAALLQMLNNGEDPAGMVWTAVDNPCRCGHPSAAHTGFAFVCHASSCKCKNFSESIPLKMVSELLSPEALRSSLQKPPKVLESDVYLPLCIECYTEKWPRRRGFTPTSPVMPCSHCGVVRACMFISKKELEYDR